MTRAIALAALLALGCVPPTVDLRNRACPCADGWVCQDDVCVPEAEARGDGGASDGGTDGGVDAGGGDAGDVDAGGVDGGGVDAGVVDAGADAGASDAGPPDAGAGATGCDGPLSSAIVCDGFESAPGPWTGRTERLGTATRTTTRAAVGASSLAASITAASGQASFDYDGLGGFTGGDLWVRASVFVPSAAVVRDFTFFAIGETVSPYHGVSLGIGGDERAGAYSTISATYVQHSATVPRDRWVCFELHVAIDETAGVIEVYMDGVRGGTRDTLDTVPAAGFDYLLAGIGYTGPMQDPLTVYLDEVALSTSRLPCP